ncbi:MAG: hypothetical protein RIR62_3027 [Pseudomonadota bacterium]|jgi:hypothetical protein
MMKRIATALITTGLVGVAATPLLAGGPVVVAEEATVSAPVPVMSAPQTGGDWAGFYGGAQLGFGNVGSTDPLAGDGDGLLGGLHAGYRMDFGTFVAGAEIAYDFANIDLGDLEVNTVNSIGRLGLTGGADLGQTLVYGAVGMATVDAEVGGVDSSADGHYYGIGVDYALSPTMTVGGQLLRHEFDDVTGGPVVANELDTTLLQAKVSFKF